MVSGSEYAFQSLETTFQQDFNADGTTGLKTTPIETSGATHLDQVANEFFLHDSAGNGPSLKYAGADVVAGQFGAWTPIGAEKVGSGYQVVWKNGGADQYVVWNVDSNGNYVSASAVLSAASTELQVLEPGFNQDLNGIGGITPRMVIESAGSTTLARIANTFVVSPTTSALGQQLKLSGAAVTVGQFGNYTPIGAEQAADGTYQVAWKNGALDQYIGWVVDSNGNYITAGPVLAGGTWYVEAFESTLHQDLNGDLTIGPVVAAPIEAFGATSLTKVADSYFCNYASGGPQLKWNGAYVAAGQFGAWTPIGAEQAADGTYQVAWKNGALDQYIGWVVDSNGNYITASPVLAGGTWYVEAFESTLHQDLNGDGTIGAVTSVVESSGVTILTKAANFYFVNYGGPSAVQINYGGAYAGANQFSGWAAIGAEQTMGGYEVVWQNGSNYTGVEHRRRRQLPLEQLRHHRKQRRVRSARSQFPARHQP